VSEPYPLKNAPIKEALIDIQVNGSKVDIQSLKTSLDDFSTPTEILLTKLQFEAGPEGSQSSGGVRTCVGYRYESSNSEFVVQFRQNGMTVSRLAPYADWEELLLMAKIIWLKYQEVTKSVDVVRLAVRYINALKIPFPENNLIDFDLYLSNGPQLPPGLGDELDHFLSRLVLSLKSPVGATAIINQTMEQPSNEHLPLVLDIDIFLKFKQDYPDDDKIWSSLELMRKAKNIIFFNTMTKAALELCK